MSRRKTTEQFIKEAKLIHGNKYDYSLVEYKNNSTKVKIICKAHGMFEQRPSDHLNNHGCKKCADEYTSSLFVWTKEKFIEEANKKYNYFYDYSLVEYKNSSTKVKIICPIHGIFKQKPSTHLHEGGCIECCNNDKKLSDKEILQSIKNNNYTFEIVSKDFKHSSDFIIKGTCKQCKNSIFKKLNSWRYGNNICQVCNEYDSIGEMLVGKCLQNNNINFEMQKKFPDLKDKNQLSYDFYLKDFNLLIECQGEQHKKPKSFGCSSKIETYKNFLVQKKHDKLKLDYAKYNNFNFLEIWYNDYEYEKIKKILKEKLLTIFQKDVIIN